MAKRSLLTAPAEIAPSGQELRTPFLWDGFRKAKKIWDDRIGTPVVQKSNWQRLAGAEAIIILVLVLVVVFRPERTVYYPYIVHVDKVTGEIRNVGLLPRQAQTPTQAMVEDVVRRVVFWVRSLPDSEIVWGQNMQEAKNYMTTPAYKMLGPFITQQKTRFAQGEVVQVTFGNMVAIAGHAGSYEVEWQEQSFSRQGMASPAINWHATVSIAVIPPKVIDPNKIQDLRNPVGIFIQDFHPAARGGEKK